MATYHGIFKMLPSLMTFKTSHQYTNNHQKFCHLVEHSLLSSALMALS